MNRRIYLQTERIGFSSWTAADTALAQELLAEKDIAAALGAQAPGNEDAAPDADAWLNGELAYGDAHGVQLWPIFALESGSFLGACGLHLDRNGDYELTFAVLPQWRGQGYAAEATDAVIRYAFFELKAPRVFAAHHPHNSAAQKLMQELGFLVIGEEPHGVLPWPTYVVSSPTAPADAPGMTR